MTMSWLRSKCLVCAVAALVAAAVGGYLWWAHHAAGTIDAGDGVVTGPAWFTDVTDQVGLDFIHDAGPVGKHFLPETFGSGAALFDFDGDGRLDLYVLTNGGKESKSINRLYKNMPDGTFNDVTEGSGLGIGGRNMGVAIGDVNNDGLPDVLVTQYGGIKLFLNRGNGKFEDVTEAAGLNNPLWGTSAAFLDYDRDGWLDLVIVNYIDYDPSWPCTYLSDKPDYCSPNVFPGTASRLFRNLGATKDGKGVRFDDTTLASGLGRRAGPGLGVVCADFNGDRWPDIFIANDGKPNHLWINQKNGTFKEEAVVCGIAFDGMGKAQAGMGVALGDVNGDGLFDLFVTHLTIESHTLWQQGPVGLFRDGTGDAKLMWSRWHGTGFGTLMGDFDHDGALDIAIVNGRIARDKAMVNAALGPHWGWYAERNQLYANDGTGKFTDVSARNPAFCGTPNVARGLVSGDVDGDGALDLIVTAIGGRVRLLRNVVPERGHWLKVRCLVGDPGRDATGAAVAIEAGKRRWVRPYNPAESYLCSSAPIAHFGLRDVTRVDTIEVIWPDGSRERFAGTAVDQQVVLRQGQGQLVDRQ
jgi:hypothetical protein